MFILVLVSKDIGGALMLLMVCTLHSKAKSPFKCTHLGGPLLISFGNPHVLGAYLHLSYFENSILVVILHRKGEIVRAFCPYICFGVDDTRFRELMSFANLYSGFSS